MKYLELGFMVLGLALMTFGATLLICIAICDFKDLIDTSPSLTRERAA